MPELIGENSPLTPPSPFGVNLQGMVERKNLLAALDAWQYLKVLGVFFYWIAGWFAISINVFLRRDFGERYLSWINLYCGYTVMATVVFWGDGMLGLFGIGTSGSGGTVLLTMYLGFVFLSFYHRFVIYLRNRKGGLWYSYSDGAPWPVLFAPLAKMASILRFVIPPPFRPEGLSNEAYDKYIEPLMVLLVGLFFLSGAAKIWCIAAAISLAFRAMMSYHAQRELMLDHIDSMLAGQNMNAAIKDQQERPRETEGFTVPRSSARLMQVASQRFPSRPATLTGNGRHASPTPLLPEAIDGNGPMTMAPSP